MKIEEIIQERRTIHRFLNEPVDTELLSEALDLARWAPNHKNTEPWRFAHIGPEVKEQILQLNLGLDPNMGSLKKEKMIHNYRSKHSLLALGCTRSENIKESRENYASVACGVQNISLYLWAKGLGCKWSTGRITEQIELYEWIKWSSAEIEIVGFLWVGKPEIIPPAPKRKGLEQVLINTP
ncbi:MAG: nitroreductase [Bdellovibrionales bacterium]|nr:nitroreductase [Bdellovibrionales bacterium]